MTKLIKRTCYCGEVNKSQVGQRINLNGYIAKSRNLGGVIFCWLRDRTGLVQLTFADTLPADVLETAASLRSEFVVGAVGTVALRTPENVNPNLATGELEVLVDEIVIYSKAKTTPFYIEENIDTNEELRLRYRYLDLRRPDMQQRMILRHKAMQATRRFFTDNGFLEVETPLLMKSTPEGARDYLVPSRVNPGMFYALPQSPQLYKQLIMYAGYDKYFQITRCLRDEDLRADRQPEFDQIDIEQSFCDMDDIMELNERFVKTIFNELIGADIPTPFTRITYKEAMETYGSDKPDTRYGLHLVNISGILKDTTFNAFAGALQSGGSVRLINAVGGGAALSRKEIDALTDVAKLYKAKGLAWINIAEGEVKSPIAKFLTEQELNGIIAAANAKVGDLLLIVADKDDIVFAALGALREHMAKRLNLIASGFNFLWVTDFPLLEYDEECGRYFAKHHPFTRPLDTDLHLLDSDPGAVRAAAYDLILNGYEVAGGSIRINETDLQHKMFEVLGFTEEQAKEQFGFLLEAFTYGVPPHGGIAYGFDRLIMLLTGVTNIREVIPFPKTQNATELMSGSPSYVPSELLQELHITSTAKQDEKV